MVPVTVTVELPRLDRNPEGTADIDENRGMWGIVLAQAASRRGDQAKVRQYAEEARKSLGLGVAQNLRDADLLAA